jgi:hypothetical protein
MVNKSELAGLQKYRAGFDKFVPKIKEDQTSNSGMLLKRT